MMEMPKPMTLEYFVLQVFSELPNVDLTREEIIHKTSAKKGKKLYPQQIDTAIQNLRKRGFRVFQTSQVYGNLWASTFRLFLNENEQPPNLNRKSWLVSVGCYTEIEAHELAEKMRETLNIEAEVRRV